MCLRRRVAEYSPSSFRILRQQYRSTYFSLWIVPPPRHGHRNGPGTRVGPYDSRGTVSLQCVKRRRPAQFSGAREERARRTREPSAARSVGQLRTTCAMLTRIVAVSERRIDMPTWTPDPSFYPSPRQAAKAPPETIAYVAAFDPDRKSPDRIAIVDVDPKSSS